MCGSSHAVSVCVNLGVVVTDTVQGKCSCDMGTRVCQKYPRLFVPLGLSSDTLQKSWVTSLVPDLVPSLVTSFYPRHT